MQYIDDARLAGLGITPADVRAAIEDVLRAIEAGTVTIAPKTMAVAPDGRYMMATLSASDADGLIAVKSVMVNDRNKARGLPGINGAILLLDAETGVLRAVLDANWVTAERTAGLSSRVMKTIRDVHTFGSRRELAIAASARTVGSESSSAARIAASASGPPMRPAARTAKRLRSTSSALTRLATVSDQRRTASA